MNTPKILCLERDAGVVQPLKTALANHGMELVQATDPLQIQVALLTADIGFALLGIDEPALHAVEAARLMQDSKIAFAILTNDADPETPDRAIQSGAMACLRKPFVPDRTVPSILMLIARAAEERRLRTSEAALKEALAGTRLISTAVGILAERLGVTPKEAFETLRKKSRFARRPLEQSADAVCASVGRTEKT